MPSIRYVNQSAPFWDFVASLENQGPSLSMPANRSAEAQGSSDEDGPWEWGTGHPWMGRGNRGFHRGPPPPRGPHGPHPPPPHHAGTPPPPPPQHEGPPPPPMDGPRPEGHQGHPPPPPHAGHPPPPPHDQSPFGFPNHDGPPHPHHHHGHGGRRGGRRGGFGRGSWGQGGFPMGGPFNFGGLAELFQQQLFGPEQNSGEDRTATQEDFKPEADVFDTETAYVVHVSLPGAKKEDIGVSWDAEKSELSIGGVVYRPGDEDLMKTLALDERKVGAFERKIRLGSRANPAQVDDDSITAKLEDGILRVEVPKLDKDYVEIKKVDIE